MSKIEAITEYLSEFCNRTINSIVIIRWFYGAEMGSC